VTKVSTAAVMISGQSFGPWGDSGWRVAGIIEVVEGGSNGPILLPQVIDESRPQHVKVVVVGSIKAKDVARSILAFLAYTWGPESLRSAFDTAGFLGRREPEGFVSDEFVPDDTLMSQAASAVGDLLKCGVVILDTISDISGQLASELRQLGLQAEEFVSAESK